MRGRLRTIGTAAMLGVAALTILGVAAPVQAHDTSIPSGQVQAAPGWHHVGDYENLTRCRQQGESWLAAGWAIRFECRDIASSTKWALWVLTNP